MALPERGSEPPVHPDLAAETRQLAERSRTQAGAHVSARAFWVAFGVILLAIALFALILWQT